MYGFVLTNRHRLAVKLLGFIDDFFIACTNLEPLLFLNFAVDCGLSAHPDKLIRPSQQVKYYGFLFNSAVQPCVKTARTKREQALAICEHLTSCIHPVRLSGLTLAWQLPQES